MSAFAIFQQAGFKKLHNLTGGILAWSDDVDPTVPKYQAGQHKAGGRVPSACVCFAKLAIDTRGKP